MTRRRRPLVTFHIELADDNGVPLLVTCDQCGTRWQRPESDMAAAGLAAWTVQHGYDHHPADD